MITRIINWFKNFFKPNKHWEIKVITLDCHPRTAIDVLMNPPRLFPKENGKAKENNPTAVS